MQTVARLTEMTAVNKEAVLVLSPGVVDSLASQGSQTSLCFQKLIFFELAHSHTICFCNIYVPLCEVRNAWADSMFT